MVQKNKNYKFGAEDSSIGLSIFVALQYIVIILLTIFVTWGLKYTKTVGYVASAVIELCFVLAVFFVAKIRKADFFKATTLSSKPDGKKLGIATVIAVISLFGFMGLTNVILGTLTKVGYEYVTSDIVVNTFPKYLLFTLTICIIPAVCEEILFRGLIFNGLSKWSKKGAVLFSALIFMLMHGSPDQTVHQFILGIVLALLFLFTGSIWAPMLMHFLNNFIALSVSYFTYASTTGGTTEALSWAQIGSLAISAIWMASIAVLLLWWLFGILKKWNVQTENDKNVEHAIEASVDGVKTEAMISIEDIKAKKQIKHFSKLSIWLFTISILLLSSDWILALLKGFGINV